MCTNQLEKEHPSPIYRTSLIVNDLERVREFYRDVLGFHQHEIDVDRAVLGTRNNGFLELKQDEDAENRKIEEAGLFHLAILLPKREHLGGIAEKLREKSLIEGTADHRVSEALYLSDPEGNGVEIYSDKPRDEWPESNNGMIQMDTLPLNVEDITRNGYRWEKIPPESCIGHIHLETSSLDKAREFYVGGLDMDIRQESWRSALFLAIGDYHHHVGLNAWYRRSMPRSGRGLESFELMMDDKDELDRILRRLDERNIKYISKENGYQLTDPDGIEITLKS